VAASLPVRPTLIQQLVSGLGFVIRRLLDPTAFGRPGCSKPLWYGSLDEVFRALPNDSTELAAPKD
jgi:hypothetical protein